MNKNRLLTQLQTINSVLYASLANESADRQTICETAGSNITRLIETLQESIDADSDRRFADLDIRCGDCKAPLARVGGEWLDLRTSQAGRTASPEICTSPDSNDTEHRPVR